MIYPVKCYAPDGTLKKEIDSHTLSVRHWKEIDIDVQLVQQLKKEKNMADPPPEKRPRVKRVPEKCPIWPGQCSYAPCDNYYIGRSNGAKYCSDRCRCKENSRKRYLVNQAKKANKS